MPQVKIRHVVSCSSEDPLHRVDNLLGTDAHRKWRCLPGEKEASVILQFEKAEKILSVDVGNEGSAFVEILVGNSSSNDADFQVLLSASCFMSPAESRASLQRSRVRMFGPELLSRAVSARRWDRARIVCRQPYNPSLAYGLAFVHFNSVPEDPSPDDAQQAKQEQRLGGFRIREDVPASGSLVPGALFSSRQRLPLLAPPTTPQALSYARAALGDLPGSPSSPSSTTKPQAASLKRKFDLPMTSQPRKRCPQTGKGGGAESRRGGTAVSPTQSSLTHGNNNDNNNNNKQHVGSGAGSAHSTSSTRGAVARTTPPAPYPRGPRASPPHAAGGGAPLTGVVLSLSGFTNPLRATLRDLGVKLGARYRPDWGPACTHLVCAFARTPKSRQAQASGALVVRRQWLEDCAAQGRRLAERRYLLFGDASSSEDEEDEARSSRRPLHRPPVKGMSVRGITTLSQHRFAVDEEEVEDMKKTKKVEEDEEVRENTEEVEKLEDGREEVQEDTLSTQDRKSDSPPNASEDPYDGTTEDPYDGTTEEEEGAVEEEVEDRGGGGVGGGETGKEGVCGPPELPELLTGRRILLHESLSTHERRSLQRLVVAWNGCIVAADEASEGVDFIIADHGWDESFDEVLAGSPAALVVRARWLRISLERGALAPPQLFAIAR